MRLFLAIELPRDVRSALDQGSRGLRGELPDARWVRPETQHLTLVFLGETDPEMVPSLDAELSKTTAAIPAMSLSPTDVGAFPPRGKARVLWAGLDSDGDLPGLQIAVRDAVERVVGPNGDTKKRKPFHPHVTLARCRSPWPRWAVDKLRTDFVWGDLRDHSIPIDQITLIRSQLLPQGPRYTTLHDYPLGGSP